METPNEDSLLEAKKRQNLGHDLVEQVVRFLERGIMVMSGLIVDFDSDGPDIFERQRCFVESAPVPIFSLGALVAPAGTPLFERMARSRRLLPNGSETPATPWETKIIPMQMTRDELLSGLRRLCNQIYQPDAFAERVIHMLERLGPYQGPPLRQNPAQPQALGSSSLVIPLKSPKKIRRMYHDRVLVGFAGATADAFSIRH